MASSCSSSCISSVSGNASSFASLGLPAAVRFCFLHLLVFFTFAFAFPFPEHLGFLPAPRFLPGVLAAGSSSPGSSASTFASTFLSFSSCPMSCSSPNSSSSSLASSSCPSHSSGGLRVNALVDPLPFPAFFLPCPFLSPFPLPFLFLSFLSPLNWICSVRFKTSGLKIDQFVCQNDEGINTYLKSVMAGHCNTLNSCEYLWILLDRTADLNWSQETGMLPVSFSSGFGGFHFSSIACLKARVSVMPPGSYGSVSSNSVAASAGNLSWQDGNDLQYPLFYV